MTRPYMDDPESRATCAEINEMMRAFTGYLMNTRVPLVRRRQVLSMLYQHLKATMRMIRPPERN